MKRQAALNRRPHGRTLYFLVEENDEVLRMASGEPGCDLGFTTQWNPLAGYQLASCERRRTRTGEVTDLRFDGEHPFTVRLEPRGGNRSYGFVLEGDAYLAGRVRRAMARTSPDS